MSNQQVALKGKIDTVRAALEAMKPQLALALPTHLTSDRLLRVTMTAVQNTPKLLDCDRTSLFSAVMTCAQLGLEPDGVLGQAYLVPYGNKVQFIPGYKGYLNLARNSGEVDTVQAHQVYKGDHFEYAYGLNERLEHVPGEGVDRSDDNITHFYAYAKYKDGGHVFEVMTKAEVDAIRDNSDGYKAFKANKIKDNPWASSYPQMGRKTAIRRLANYLPLNVQRAAAIEGAFEHGKVAAIDNFGDVVIDSQAEEVSAQTGANGATSKLDQLAGADGNGAESKDEAPEKPPNMTQLKNAIKAATTADEVDLQLDLSRHLSKDQQEKVLAAAKARKKQLVKDVQQERPAQTPPAADGGGLFGDE